MEKHDFKTNGENIWKIKEYDVLQKRWRVNV